MHHSYVHSDLTRILGAFRYDAHPMAMMVSAFGALGSFHAEANPSLQGQKLYSSGTDDSLRKIDKQLYRLIGKAPTIAAMAYRVRQGRPFNRPPAGLSYTASLCVRGRRHASRPQDADATLRLSPAFWPLSQPLPDRPPQRRLHPQPGL